MIKDLGKNKYRFVVSVGSGATRKRYTKTVIHKGGKKELQKLYEEFENECLNSPQVNCTVGELLNDYLEHCKTLGRKPTTIHGYEVALKRLSEPLQTISAKKCTTYHLQKEIALMANNGLSAKTIKNTMGIVSAAYRFAIKTELLTDNPCERITLPTGQPRDIRIFYIDEIQPFLDAISECDIDEKVAYELALFMGLRRSEIMGLRESDVDIVSGMIDIHSTRHRINGNNYEADTKTKRSTRVLALPDILITDIAILLETHRRFPYESTDYLIQNGCGQPIGAQALSNRLVRLEEKHNLPHVTLHGLRHTYASLLNASGVDMAMISAELGHSNLATTQNIYTHRFKTPSQSSRQIANTINDFGQKWAQNGHISEIKNP